MKTNSSSRIILTLLALAAVTAALGTNAHAGDRRGGAPPAVTTSGVAPAVSVP